MKSCVGRCEYLKARSGADIFGEVVAHDRKKKRLQCFWPNLTRHVGIDIESDGPNIGKKKVLPGIEPGLPEDTEVIRIRSDNRYLVRN